MKRSAANAVNAVSCPNVQADSTRGMCLQGKLLGAVPRRPATPCQTNKVWRPFNALVTPKLVRHDTAGSTETHTDTHILQCLEGASALPDQGPSQTRTNSGGVERARRAVMLQSKGCNADQHCPGRNVTRQQQSCPAGDRCSQLPKFIMHCVGACQAGRGDKRRPRLHNTHTAQQLQAGSTMRCVAQTL